MRYETIKITAGEYAGELTAYEHTASAALSCPNRPALLVLPGGGYGMCSERESEPIALEFFNRGYNAYVLVYPCAPARYPAQLCVAAAAMDCICKRARNGNTDNKKVFAVGFSAGGHLCACLANCPENFAPVQKYNYRPDGILLGYPVIGGEPTHGGSFYNLLGGKPTGDTAWLDLHTSVRADNPPAFIWATADDQAVPVVNSLRYAAAYARNNLRFALHIYPKGPHGLSLADARTSGGDPAQENGEIAQWVDMADTFMRSI